MAFRLNVLATAAILAVLAAGCEKKPEPPGPPDVAAPEVAMAALQPRVSGTIKRLHIYDDVWLASQPSPEDFELARDDGVRTIINQRPAREMEDFDEGAHVTSLGLRYLNPGWNGADELTDEIIDETRQMLRTAERPVMLHCGSANRVGAIWFAYRVLDDGLTVDAALAEAKTVGLRTPEYEVIVRDYVERNR